MRLNHNARTPLRYIALGIFWSVFVTANIPALFAQTNASDKSLPSPSVLNFELANAHRLLGDEHFIDGEREQAKKAYESAQGAMTIAENEGTPQNLRDEFLLMRTELEYRLNLLRNNMSFWGNSHSRRPLVPPPRAFSDFDALAARFISRIDEYEDVLDDLDANNNDQTDALMSLESNAVQAQVSALESTMAFVSESGLTLQINQLRDRQAAIQGEQRRLVTERQIAQQALDAAIDQFNGALSSAVMASVGLPPDMEDLANDLSDGDLAGALETAAVSALSSSNDELDEILGDMGQIARDAAETYHEVQAKFEEAARVQETIELAMVAAREENMGALFRAGSVLVKELDPESYRAFEEAVSPYATPESLIKLAAGEVELRDLAMEYLGENVEVAGIAGDQLGSFLEQLVEDQSLEALGRILSDYALNNAELEKYALDFALSAIPDQVLGILLNTADVEFIAKALKLECSNPEACRPLLILLNDEVGLLGLLVIEVTASGKIAILNQDGDRHILSIDTADLLSLLGDIEGSAYINSDIANAAYLSFFQSALGDGDEELARIVGRSLPAAEFSAFTRSLNVDLSAPLQNATQDEVLKPLMNLFAGAELAQTKQAQSTSIVVRTAPPAVEGGGSTEEAVTMLALNAALPGAGAAISAIGALGAMDEAGDRLDEIDAQDRRLTEELMHLQPFQTKLDTDRSVAEQQGRIARLRVRSAERRSSRYANRVTRIGSRSQAIEDALRDRHQVIFLEAELLRESFDRLDAALAYWYGGSNEDTGRIESYYRTRAEWSRYQLDTEIELFSWLDRSQDGQRSDFGSLRNHWERMQTLVTQACQRDFRCGPQNRGGGDVRSVSIRASDHWVPIEASQGEAARYQLLLSPSLVNSPVIGGHQRLVNVVGQFVDRRTGAIVDPPAISLFVRHTGLGFIGDRGAGYSSETLDISESHQIPLAQNGQVVEQWRTLERNRWSNVGYTLKPIEGYALFGFYEFTLPNDPNLIERYELRVFFYYQSIEEQRTYDDIDGLLVNCVGPSGKSLEMSTERLALLITGIDDGPEGSQIQLGNGQRCEARQRGRFDG